MMVKRSPWPRGNPTLVPRKSPVDPLMSIGELVVMLMVT